MPVLTAPQLPPALHRLLMRLSAFDEVEQVILFGSRGDDLCSDIDLAVRCPEADAAKWARIMQVVSDVPATLGIDLLRLDPLAAEMKASIEKEGIVVYDRSK